MSHFLVRATCGKCGEKQGLRFEGTQFTRQYVEQFAGLLDGTSPLYVYPPGTSSDIGKCGMCGGRFTAEVTEGEVP